MRELRESYTKVRTDTVGGGSAGVRVVPTKLLRQFEEQESRKEAELEKVRLKNIHLRNQLRKLEGPSSSSLLLSSLELSDTNVYQP